MEEFDQQPPATPLAPPPPPPRDINPFGQPATPESKDGSGVDLSASLDPPRPSTPPPPPPVPAKDGAAAAGAGARTPPAPASPLPPSSPPPPLPGGDDVGVAAVTAAAVAVAAGASSKRKGERAICRLGGDYGCRQIVAHRWTLGTRSRIPCLLERGGALPFKPCKTTIAASGGGVC